MSEEERIVKVGCIKNGSLGMALMLDLLFDERADREDVDFMVVGSGAKLGKAQAVWTAERMVEWKPELILMVSPNAALGGLKAARDVIEPTGIPTVVFSDAPAKKACEEIEGRNMGYFINLADSMIGARRPFLDPVEMALFNANLLQVLCNTGVLNLMQDAIDPVINALKEGQKPALPRIICNKEKAVAAAQYDNPYAHAKALAAFEIAAKVAAIDVTACFKLKEKERYMPLLAAAHEMMQDAARLSGEAREVEKYNDTVLRRPHHRKGKTLTKKALMEKEE